MNNNMNLKSKINITKLLITSLIDTKLTLLQSCWSSEANRSHLILGIKPIAQKLQSFTFYH